MAAHRAGIENIILPRDNQKDLADLPSNIQDALKINLVEHMDEVLEVALERKLEPPPSQVSDADITASLRHPSSETDQDRMTN